MTLTAALSAFPVAGAAANHQFSGAHSNGLVVASIALATLGSFAALASAARIRPASGAKRLGWIILTAIALGGGAIWSTHFVGTVAYHAYSDVTLDFGVTVLSAVIAVGVAGIGVGAVAADPFNPGRLVGGGTFAGFGITAMHYTGLAALRTPGTVDYDWALVVSSLAVAVLAATTAFWIAFHVGGTARVAVASTVMAATISGVHYTGMAAMHVNYDPRMRPEAGVDPFALATTTAFASVVVLMFIIFAALGGVVDPTFAVKRIPHPDDTDTASDTASGTASGTAVTDADRDAATGTDADAGTGTGRDDRAGCGDGPDDALDVGIDGGGGVLVGGSGAGYLAAPAAARLRPLSDRHSGRWPSKPARSGQESWQRGQ